jgi:hypothetical protein
MSRIQVVLTAGKGSRFYFEEFYRRTRGLNGRLIESKLYFHSSGNPDINPSSSGPSTPQRNRGFVGRFGSENIFTGSAIAASAAGDNFSSGSSLWLILARNF